MPLVERVLLHVEAPASPYLRCALPLVALLASFIAKKNAIAALGILYGSAQGSGLAAALAAQVSAASALSFIAASMLFIPCVATMAAMRKETGSWGWTLFGTGLQLEVALGMSALIYQGCHLSGFGMGTT